jgi:hypothetical protein
MILLFTERWGGMAKMVEYRGPTFNNCDWGISKLVCNFYPYLRRLEHLKTGTKKQKQITDATWQDVIMRETCAFLHVERSIK